MKKVFPLILVFTFVFILGMNLFEQDTVFAQTKTGILSQIRSSNSDDLVNKADQTGANVIGAIRRIGIVVAVGMLAWIGFRFWQGGRNPQALMESKAQILWFFVGLFITFGAEVVIGTFLDWLGFDHLIK